MQHELLQHAVKVRKELLEWQQHGCGGVRSEREVRWVKAFGAEGVHGVQRRAWGSGVFHSCFPEDVGELQPRTLFDERPIWASRDRPGDSLPSVIEELGI